MFHTRPDNVVERLQQKVKEYIIAARLEKAYTKEEIITMYLNQIDFLHNAVGIKSAANVYFNISPDSLSIEESAVIVGMAKNPSSYNPKLFPERSERRRNVVLSQMEKYGFINNNQYDSLIKVPLQLDFRRISHNMGPATYFREFLRRTLTAKEPHRKNYYNYPDYIIDSLKWRNDPLYGWCNKNKKPGNVPYDIYSDGLRIYTTINSEMQDYAEKAVQRHLGTKLQDDFNKEKKGKKTPFSRDLTQKEIDMILYRAMLNSDRGKSLRRSNVSTDSIYKSFKTKIPMTIFSWKGDVDTIMSPLDSIIYYKSILRSGFLAMDPVSGHVKAYVGGPDFKYFKYDQVTQGKRQAGSTFKPFLYILAMEEGYSPCYKVPNVKQIFETTDSVWIPKSLSKPQDLNQERSLRWGLARSENNISAWLVKQFNPLPIADIAHKMGIKSYIDPVPPMIYGTSDMSVEEMVSSYATFANSGVHTEPVYVTRIEDKNGNVLSTFHTEYNEVISEQTAYLMLKLMEGVTSLNLREGFTRSGTAATLRVGEYGFTGEIAGKTGTTQNGSDTWFLGITPKLVAGVWVGFEDRSVHFESNKGTGSYSALPIWGHFMKQVYENSDLSITQEDVFTQPEGFNVLLDCASDNEKEYEIPVLDEEELPSWD
ncbi:MAG: penicillin-binding protein [Bacteroidales bacterium]|nr:penicillin-binding protein [Bacteroidales bacterium]